MTNTPKIKIDDSLETVVTVQVVTGFARMNFWISFNPFEGMKFKMERFSKKNRYSNISMNDISFAEDFYVDEWDNIAISEARYIDDNEVQKEMNFVIDLDGTEFVFSANVNLVDRSNGFGQKYVLNFEYAY